MTKKAANETINAKGIKISVYSENHKDDFISLTDIAKYKENIYPSEVINSWLRNRNTVEYLGLWENIHHPENFNSIEFDRIEREAGKNAFILTPKRWIDSVNAKGMITKAGRYAATYAHKDIALKFASWLSAEFELYIIKDYQRLKTDESSRLSLNWNLNRELSKLNYKIHTDAIKENLIPKLLNPQQIGKTYADEADVLNIALFGMTAKAFRKNNPELKGNMREHATIHQLLVLSNMESYNAVLLEQNLPQTERLQLLNKLAIKQLAILEQPNNTSIRQLDRNTKN